MEIDRLTPADIPAALRLSTQAGWNQLEADWRRLIGLWPDGCFAGRVDGHLVATATLATYRPSTAWVGMVLVDESQRGQGYGGAIMDHVIAEADRPHVHVRTLVEALAPGSYMALSHLTDDVDEPGMTEVASRLEASMGTTYPPALRCRADVLRFFDGLDLLEPGLVPAPEWRPDGEPDGAGRHTPLLAGVARKP